MKLNLLKSSFDHLLFVLIISILSVEGMQLELRWSYAHDPSITSCYCELSNQFSMSCESIAYIYTDHNIKQRLSICDCRFSDTLPKDEIIIHGSMESVINIVNMLHCSYLNGRMNMSRS